MKKFEYKELWANIPLSDDNLTYDHGIDGWELCGFTESCGKFIYYFKREITENE